MKRDQAPCPACRAPLHRASSRWEVLACLACGGVWTDTGASRRITNTVDRELVSIAKEVAKQASQTDPLYERVSNMPADMVRECPICAKALACVRTGHVAVDVCTEHGTWFDKDELGRLARNLEFERVSGSPSIPEETGAQSRNAQLLLSLLGRGE